MIGKREKIITNLKGSLSSGQKHFDKESYFEIKEIPEGDPIKQYRMIKAEDWEKFPIGCLEKLVGARLLVTETTITKSYLFQQRLESLSQEIKNADLFDTIKTMGVSLEEFDEELFKKDATEFSRMFRERPWELTKSRPEDLYPDTIEEILHRADPLRVDIDVPILASFGKRRKPDSPYTRELERLHEWFVDNYVQILNGDKYELPPVQIIEDDPIIEQTARNLIEDGINTIVYVTDDKKMVAKIRNKNLGCVHYRISARDWVSIGGDEAMVLKRMHEHFNSKMRVEVIIDTGSLDTFMDKTGSSYSLGVPYTESNPPGWTSEITRPPVKTNLSMTKTYRRKQDLSRESIISMLNLRNSQDEISILHLTRSVRSRTDWRA
jgi:hypothetical protein